MFRNMGFSSARVRISLSSPCFSCGVFIFYDSTRWGEVGAVCNRVSLTERMFSLHLVFVVIIAAAAIAAAVFPCAVVKVEMRSAVMWFSAKHPC